MQVYIYIYVYVCICIYIYIKRYESSLRFNTNVTVQHRRYHKAASHMSMRFQMLEEKTNMSEVFERKNIFQVLEQR